MKVYPFRKLALLAHQFNIDQARVESSFIDNYSGMICYSINYNSTQNCVLKNEKN